MDFEIKHRPKTNAARYHQEELDIAYAFANKVVAELGQYLKAIVLYRKHVPKDPYADPVNMLCIIDDVSIHLTPAVVESFRVSLEKHGARISKRIKIVMMKISSFWEHAKVGDPLTMVMLREGLALTDTGFFEPLQYLLKEGRIKPTEESVSTYQHRAKQTMKNARWHTLQATLALYWAAIDAAHAALMKQGAISPSPEHVAKAIDDHLVKKKLVQKKYATIMANLFKISKMITHREIQHISGKQFEHYLKDTQDFVATMRHVVES